MKKVLFLPILLVAVACSCSQVTPTTPRKADSASHRIEGCEERSGYTVSAGRSGECVYTPI